MRVVHGLLLMVILILVAGCARFPADSGGSNAPARTLYSRVMINNEAGGVLRPSNYFFLAIGVDQTSGTGPVPVVTGIGSTNGWGTIAPLPGGRVEEPPFYIVYHNNSFAMYRNGSYIGQPFRGGVIDNREIWVEFDLESLSPLLGGDLTNKIIQLNWICMETLDASPIPGLIKPYDGFGAEGNRYFSVPLDAAATYMSGEGAAPEEPPFGIFERTTNNPDIDMIHWVIEVKRRRDAG